MVFGDFSMILIAQFTWGTWPSQHLAGQGGSDPRSPGSIFPPGIPQLMFVEVSCPYGKRTVGKRLLSLSNAHDQRPSAA